MSIFQNRSSFGHTSGRRLATLFLAVICGLFASQSAFASNVTVSSPLNGSNLSSTAVWVRAHNVGCNGLAPTSFGFSLDGSSTITWGSTVYDVDVSNYYVPTGTHTIHFKSWVSGAACPTVDTTFSVGGSSSSSSSSSGIPSYAVASADLSTSGNWYLEHDGGTPGSSWGSTKYPATTPSWDTARQMYMTYSYYGGERWHISWGSDGNAHNFVFDTYVYFTNPGQVQNLELDMNQVTWNGETYLYGTQCSSITNTWEYSYVSGNAPHWRASNVYCNPKSWGANTWHHVQIGYHRDNYGNVTHDYVVLDGNRSNFYNTTSPGGMWLGWAGGSLLANYQIDGAYSGSGSVNSYIHKTTIYRW